MTGYEIEARSAGRALMGDWSADGVGDDNWFSTHDEAEDAISALRDVDDGFVEYRVVSASIRYGGPIAEPDDYCERMGCGQAGLTSRARRIWCLEDREIARLARLSS